MEFPYFLSLIPQINHIISNENYSGVPFQLKMSPKDRFHLDLSSIKYKEAAVLVFLYPKNNQTHVLLTQRASYKGTHSAQISFPGGKKDSTDATLLQTALRESEEEVGLQTNTLINTLALSSVYIPPSNFLVSPFLGYATQKPHFNPNYEVKEIIEVPLTDLLDDTLTSHKSVIISNSLKMQVPCFIFNEHVVWGATAAILSELKELIKLVK